MNGTLTTVPVIIGAPRKSLHNFKPIIIESIDGATYYKLFANSQIFECITLFDKLRFNSVLLRYVIRTLRCILLDDIRDILNKLMHCTESLTASLECSIFSA